MQHASVTTNDFDNSITEDLSYQFGYNDELELNQGVLCLTICTNTLYGDLLTKAKLVSVVKNDQNLRKSIFTSMSVWMEHLETNSDIEDQFITPILSTIRKSQSVISNNPIPVVTNPVKTVCTMKRKRSLVEFRRLGTSSGNGNKHISRSRSATHNNSRDC